MLSANLLNEIWLLYLRKSRQDNPNETVEEVLAKHETILQEWAKRELGYAIPEEFIYREVVSGESIEDRVEIKKVLARIEDPRVVGVIVVEPQRLSRGDLEDCGKLINDFRYTNTLVATPSMTYNLNNKMERKFFQDELLRGRDYLEYTKEILMRGRLAAIKRGCYISHKTPYGYRRVKIGKDNTLEPDDNADVVRMIFDFYVNHDMSYYKVAKTLNDMKIPSPTGIEWSMESVRVIVKNYHYDGKVTYCRQKMTTVVENGERVSKRVRRPMDEVVIAEGKHPAIVDHDLFQRAQEKVNSHPPTTFTNELKNPYSGILVCKQCGKALQLRPYKRSLHRLGCRTTPQCYKSAKYIEVNEAVITALEQVELPKLQAKAQKGEGKSAAIQQRILARLEKQMQEYRSQEETQYELLETKKYTQELFDRRNAALRKKMEDCQAQIYETKSNMPKEVNYEEKVLSLQEAISALRDDSISAEKQNRLLKKVVDKILYSVGETSWNKTDIKLEIVMRL